MGSERHRLRGYTSTESQGSLGERRDGPDAHILVPEVREHEPHVALFAGVDGLSVFGKLFPSAATRLAPGGRLIVEVGYDQDDRVAAIGARYGWTLSHVRQDLQAITRTLIFTRHV